MNINVKIKLLRGARCPEYATADAAAVDLRAATEGEEIRIPAGERRMIPTGIAIEPMRPDVAAIVAARSGLGCKKGITLANGIGVIDADYRGEIAVTLLNTSDEDFIVRDGDRVAQMMFLPVLHGIFDVVDSLDETARGEGGFGSTGVK